MTPSRTELWPAWCRFLLLNAGLLLFGFAIALQIRANVGLAPWDALHMGLHHHFPRIAVGTVSIAVGVLIQLTAWLLLKMPIGIGSAVNVIAIGSWINFFLPRLPTFPTLWAAWSVFLLGIALAGLAIGTYIAANFGAGPRDSLALGLARKTGWPVRRVRSLCELLVVAAGWALGAKVGLGTLVFALLIGPAMQLGLKLFGLHR